MTRFMLQHRKTKMRIHAAAVARSRSALAALVALLAVPSPSRAADRDVDAALQSMTREMADVRESCDEPVTVDAKRVALSDKVGAVHVVLRSPLCLGKFGQYDYLLVENTDGRWRTIQDGGPGLLTFERDRGSRFARIDVLALMNCKLSFAWDGSIYVRHASPECDGGRKGPEWQILEHVIRVSEAPPPPPADASPTALLADIVGRVDREQMLDWTSPRFGSAMRRYLSPELISAVEHGREVASGVDLYDAEFFTGKQAVNRVKLFQARIISSDGERAVVSAVIGTSEARTTPRTGTAYTYFFRFSDGSWKVDDFRTDPKVRTVKDVFMHPENGDPVAR